MGVSQGSDSFELADYLGVLRRRWWIVLALTCVGVLAAGAYVKLSPKTYKATATVNVTATGMTQNQGGAVAGGRTNNAINLDTEAQIVQSGTVAGIAASMLHSSLPPKALLANVSVAVPANSAVLQISCQAPSGRQAAACANAFAAAYLRNRSVSAAHTINIQSRVLGRQLTTLEKEVAQLTGHRDSLPAGSEARASAAAQLQTTRNQLRSLANQAAMLTAQAAASSGGRIITKATPPASPSSPKKLLAFPSGLLAGVLMGLIGAFALDRLDRRIHSGRDVERFLGIPALLSLSGKDLGGAPVPSRSAAGREFAELAWTAAAALGEENQTLVVAGTSPGSSTSVVAVDLAVTLARTHSAVALVCTGPDGTVTPELLGLEKPRWLDEQRVAKASMGSALDRATVRWAGCRQLCVLTLAADLRNLQQDVTRRLTVQLRVKADYVVIEAQPRGGGADGFALAAFADAAIVVVEASRTSRSQAMDCIRRLGRLNIPVLGAAVLSPLRAPSSSLRGWRARLPRPGPVWRRLHLGGAASRATGDTPRLAEKRALTAKWLVDKRALTAKWLANGRAPTPKSVAAEDENHDVLLSGQAHAEPTDRLTRN